MSLNPPGVIARVRRRLHAIRCSLRGVDERSSVPIYWRTDLKRLGGSCGWVVPMSLLGRGAICYCVGAGKDLSFDVALARELGCEVHTFDPTPEAIQYVNSVQADLPENVIFHPWGVWARDERKRFYAPKDPRHVSHSLVNLQKTARYFEAECKRLQTILAQLGHTALALLKLDIEGAEYEVIQSMIADDIRPKTLAVEFDEIHTPLDANAKSRITGVITRLVSDGYRLVAVEGPNYTFVDHT